MSIISDTYLQVEKKKKQKQGERSAPPVLPVPLSYLS